MRFLTYISLVLIAVFAGTPNAAPAEESAPRIGYASAAVEPPIIDGVIEEDVWKDAELFTDFIQSEPVQGEPASEKTEVRILYDATTLYIGVICYDKEPDGIIINDARRDSDLSNMDSFQVILDTYHDKQNGFIFGTNAASVEYDAQVTNEGDSGRSTVNRQQGGSGAGFNLNWDGSWTVSSRISDIGWTAEFAIPLRTLRYESSKPQTWGLNFYRNIRRKREDDYWAPIPRIYDLNRLSMAGELQNLQLEVPRNFKVIPYVRGDASRAYELQENTDYDGAVGFDAKFGVTSTLNLDGTVQTDFAQVEVDEQQINFDRFNLFFPEKRPFFLENAGFFTVGKASGRDQSVELFFSRRIGLDPDGEIVPIMAGARLSGKAGSYNVGFLNMQTDEVLGVTAPNNFTVARVYREFGDRSNLGGLFINRTATGSTSNPNDWNRTFSLDGKLGIGDEITFNGFAARTETPGFIGRQEAYNFRGSYRNNTVQFLADYTQVGEDFNPEVGFLQRAGYRSVEIAPLFWVRTPSVSWLRELRPHVTYRSFWDFDGFHETEYIHLDVHVDFENGGHFSPATNLTLEGLKEPFEISDGIVIPPGQYRNTILGWRWNTNQAATISYTGELNYGGFFSGTRKGIGTTITFRRGSALAVSGTWAYNNIELPQGSFVTNLGQFRFNYNFTPRIYLQSLFQYNDDADVWSSNIRFAWLQSAAAATGLYVVYNDTRGLGDLIIGRADRSFIVKYNYQIDILK